MEVNITAVRLTAGWVERNGDDIDDAWALYVEQQGSPVKRIDRWFLAIHEQYDNDLKYIPVKRKYEEICEQTVGATEPATPSI